MSLYIGNLSSRISRHELERVFKRFGRCNVRMKDGYGFVVYDSPPNAEIALRELHNRNICGEPLTLQWSNKQPRADRRSARADRANQPQHDQDFVRAGCMSRKLADLDDQQESRMNFKQPAISGGRRFSSAEMHDEETVVHPHAAKEVTGEDCNDYRENFLDVDNDRWGEKFSDLPVENGVEHAIEFDRYEPAQGYDENYQMTYSSSSTLRKSQENTGRDHFSEGNSHPSETVKFRGLCYRCGRTGHKMLNCPQKNASQKQLSMFDHRLDGEIDRRGRDEGKLERYRSRSREKLHSSRGTSSTKRINPDIKLSSGKHQRSISSGRSPVAKNIDRPWRKDYNGNKRSRKLIDYGKEHSPKKSRSFSSPLHSDHSVPKLHSTSHSSKHRQRSCSRSRSKSISPRARSVSPSSKSSPASYYYRSKTSKFRSRSPTSLSLPGSPGQPLPSSSNKAQLNLKGPLDNPGILESKENVIEQGEPAEGDNGLEDAKLEDKMVVVKDDFAIAYSEEETKTEEHKAPLKDNYKYETHSTLLNEGASRSTPEAEKAVATGNFFPESSIGAKYHPASDPLMMGPTMLPIEIPKLDADESSFSRNSTSISSEELSMVLKHYGLDFQGEKESDLTADAHFGSARLWPWQIVYYRRLKKGPVTIENYAKRVEQNKEFHIVDKFIRSSSGWGEPGQDTP